MLSYIRSVIVTISSQNEESTLLFCWLGVTAIRPDDLESNGGVGAVAGTATDLNWDTYILSGAAMMKDGECVRSGYPLDLDTLTVGSRVGE